MSAKMTDAQEAEGGRFRILALKTLLYGPELQPLAHGVIQPEHSSTLVKGTAYAASCGSFKELLKFELSESQKWPSKAAAFTRALPPPVK